MCFALDAFNACFIKDVYCIWNVCCVFVFSSMDRDNNIFIFIDCVIMKNVAQFPECDSDRIHIANIHLKYQKSHKIDDDVKFATIFNIKLPIERTFFICRVFAFKKNLFGFVCFLSLWLCHINRCCMRCSEGYALRYACILFYTCSMASYVITYAIMQLSYYAHYHKKPHKTRNIQKITPNGF